MLIGTRHYCEVCSFDLCKFSSDILMIEILFHCKKCQICEFLYLQFSNLYRSLRIKFTHIIQYEFDNNNTNIYAFYCNNDNNIGYNDNPDNNNNNPDGDHYNNKLILFNNMKWSNLLFKYMGWCNGVLHFLPTFELDPICDQTHDELS